MSPRNQQQQRIEDYCDLRALCDAARHSRDATANTIARLLSEGRDPTSLVPTWADEEAELHRLRRDADEAWHLAFGPSGGGGAA